MIAKITRPVFSGVCLRKRLFARLDKGKSRPVVWITGPAGAGKTILASTYIETRKADALWYLADSGDSDPATFFYYLGEAAKDGARSKGRRLPVFAPEYAHGLNVFAKRFFEGLFLRVRPSSCLVIDNYHEISGGSQVHEAVKEGLCAMPSGMRSIILSRSGPPGAFARLIASGTIDVIGPDELSLTPDESSCMAKKKLGSRGAKEANGLIRAAGGWAAGLAIMLAEESSGGVGPSAELAKGRLFDYFASEIFNRTDETTRSLLIKTSVLSEFDAPLAARVAGIRDAGEALEELYRSNYFTERRLLARPVYKYHPLFREFLLEELRKAHGDEATGQIRARAAASLEELGEYEEAAALLQETRNWDSLARIVVRYAPGLMAQGRHQILGQWLSSFPEHMIKSDPWLLYWTGASARRADPAKARRLFSEAYASFKKRNDASGLYLSWASIADTFFFEWKDFRPLDGWIKELGRLRARHPRYPSVDMEERVVASMFGALVFRQPGNPGLRDWEKRVMEVVFRKGESPSRILIANNLIFYYLWTGRYARARLVIENLSGAFTAGEPDLPRIMWCVVNALYNFHTSCHAEALDWVNQGLEASNVSGIGLLRPKLLGLGSFSSVMGQREIKEAEGYSAAMKGAIDRGNCFDLTYYHQQASRIAFARGDLSGAIENIAVAAGYAERLGAPFLEGMVQTLYSYYLIEAGEAEESRARLGHLKRLARATGSVLFEYIGLLHEALDHLNSGRDKECAGALRKAMPLGKRHGIRYLNVISPESSARLMAKALVYGAAPEFTSELISTNYLVSPDPDTEHWPWRLRVKALGPFEVYKGQKRIQFARKAQQKPLDLLKALITLGSRSVSERLITDMLWPEAEGDAAHGAFATTLHRLRNLIGCDHRALELVDGKLSLDPRCCWVDLWAFERCLKRVESQLKAGRVEVALVDLDRAIELYGGDFLSSDTDAPWASVARERIRGRLLRALTEASARLSEGPGADRAVEYLHRGLELDDCNEALCRRLIELLIASGRRTDALEAFGRLTKALAVHTGTEPAPATKALLKGVSRGDYNQ